VFKLKLPFWLDGAELAKLMAAAQAWWNKVEEWLNWPLLQMDPATCLLPMLDLLAWQRDITRSSGEVESLYRLRVTHAYINAVDAGSTIGLKRILMRLGVGEVEIHERVDDRDWDVVFVRVSDEQSSQHAVLLRELIRHYGRTCRRYDFLTINPLDNLRVYAVDFNDDQQTLVASYEDQTWPL
jgi:hypothetical protein